MTTVIRRTAATDERGPERSGRRVLGTRAALPRGRAVIGALLVAGSAVGLLLAHQSATRPDEQLWLVATHDLAFGDRIGADDLALAPMDLYGPTGGRAFRDGARVVGKVARTPIAAGDLIQRGAVELRSAPTGPARRLALELTPAQALDGAIASGDRVDVLGTDETTEETAPLATGALVVSVSRPDGGLGALDSVRLSIVVPDVETAQAVIGASVRGEVALVAAADLPGEADRGR